MTSKEYIEIAVIVVRVTAHAVLIDHSGKHDEWVWVPKSQISDWTDGPDDSPGIGTTSILIPEWLAIEKGMV